MRILIRGLVLAVLWIITIVLIYPVLHEGGHALGAGIAGLEVVAIEVFPHPCVTVFPVNATRLQLLSVCLGGSVFASIAAVSFRAWNAVSSIAKLMLGLVCIFHHSCSLLEAILCRFGIIITDDADPVLYGSASSVLFIVVIHLFAVFILIREICRKRFFRELTDFFQNDNNMLKNDV